MTRTIVTLQIEVHDSQPYADKLTAEDIRIAAKERALHQVACLNRDDMRVVGKPKVTLVIDEES